MLAAAKRIDSRSRRVLNRTVNMLPGTFFGVLTGSLVLTPVLSGRNIDYVGYSILAFLGACGAAITGILGYMGIHNISKGKRAEEMARERRQV